MIDIEFVGSCDMRTSTNSAYDPGFGEMWMSGVLMFEFNEVQ